MLKKDYDHLYDNMSSTRPTGSIIIEGVGMPQIVLVLSYAPELTTAGGAAVSGKDTRNKKFNYSYI